MRVTALETYFLSVPLPRPVRTSNATIGQASEVIIHVHAVAASPTGFILESFADASRDPLWFELFRERPAIVDGFMALPEAPGLGLELRADTLEKYGVKIGA